MKNIVWLGLFAAVPDLSISRRGHELGCACHVGISDVAVLPREESACDTTVESAIQVHSANHAEMGL